MLSFDALKHRKIFQWTIAYLAGAWLIMQLVGWLADAYNWPHMVLRILPILLFIGLLITLVVAWYHGEAGRQRVSAPELVMIAGILLLATLGVALVRRGSYDNEKHDGDVAPAAATSDQGSIAVLPFADMSAHKDQAYFSDGLSEELLNVLAQLPGLRVAARTSSFSFRDKNLPIDSIGRALHVEYVLEGSVRTAGERVRITAQLVKAATGFHQWSNTYDRDLKDVFAVQDEISRSIVQALRLKLENTDTTTLARAGTQNRAAHEALLKGTFHLGQRTTQDAALAMKYFQQAIDLDPKYAAAYAGLADAIHYRAYRRVISPAKGYEDARAAAKKALELDPELPMGYVVLARVQDLHDWDFANAEKSFARAVELNPGLADAHALRAWLLMRLGRTKEAIASATRAVELNPVAPTAYNTLGSMYAYAHRPQESIEAYRNALQFVKGADVVNSNLMLSYVDAHQIGEAEKLADGMSADNEDSFVLASRAVVYAHANRVRDAEAMIAKLRTTPEGSPYMLASALAGLGRKDEVFALLDKAVAAHDDLVPDLGVDPVFDSVRSDPRMAKLLKRIFTSPTLH